MINKVSPKQKQRYYSKIDIFLSRLASILHVPQGVVRNMFSERAISTIRINNLAGKPETIVSILKRKGLALKEIPWIENVYFVLNRDKSELGEMSEYRKALFYIQNLSSMLPPALLNPQSKDIVLDMCAAPGSKTTQLAGMLNNTGRIIANDDDAWRAQKMKRILEDYKVKNTEIKIGDGKKYGSLFSCYFDKILLDAPCSGEGQIYLAGESPLRFWSINKIKVMARTQSELIESAFKALKPGGTMIYSTCTLEPNENEAVVDALLKKHKDAQVKEIELIHKPEFKEFRRLAKPGITEWNEFKLSPEVKKTIRISPSAEMMGFYVAQIVKTK